jgi:hypothetical protein
MSKEAELYKAGVHDDSAVVSVADTTRAPLPELRLVVSVVHLQVLDSVAAAFEVVSATAADEEVDSAVAEEVVAVAASEVEEGATVALGMADQTEHHLVHVDQVASEEVAMIVAHQEEAAAVEETTPTSSPCLQEEEAMIVVAVEDIVTEIATSTVVRNGHSRVGMTTRDKDDATNGSIEHGKTLPTNHFTPKGKYTDQCSSWQPLTLQFETLWTR